LHILLNVTSPHFHNRPITYLLDNYSCDSLAFRALYGAHLQGNKLRDHMFQLPPGVHDTGLQGLGALKVQ